MKALLTALFFMMFFAHDVYAQTSDNHTLLQIARGDKLVLSKDLFLPANTSRVEFGVIVDSGYLATGCALLLNPSPSARKIPQHATLVFSGQNQQLVTKNEFGNTDYRYTAGVMNSESVASLQCYGTSHEFYGTKSLYISGMKNNLKDTFDFVATEPEITN